LAPGFVGRERKAGARAAVGLGTVPAVLTEDIFAPAEAQINANTERE
jgi:hypothetical protein